MTVTFDPNKNAKNIAERGLSFELVESLEWTSALIKEDTRKHYGEVRLQILALLDDSLYAAVVTPRDRGLRVISFRRANKREMRLYGEKGG